MRHWTITRVRDTLSFRADGKLQAIVEVTWELDDAGPFTELFAREEFSGPRVREIIEARVREIDTLMPEHPQRR